MKARAFAAPAGALLAALLPTGCSADISVPDHLGGHEVGTMAERELEAENPRLVPGTLSCPDLDYRPGASVRCLRTTELSQGRVVKVRGTVEVASVSSGGRLHVTMDPQAAEFGLAGEAIAADLRKRFVQRFHAEPTAVTCPYLPAEVDRRVTCRLDAGGVRHDVEVVVTAVDPDAYRTTYVTRPAPSSAGSS